MTKNYTYELWDGKKAIGHVTSRDELRGAKVVIRVPYEDPIEVLLATRLVSDDGVNIVLRRILDVRRKSKRQIEVIKRIISNET